MNRFEKILAADVAEQRRLLEIYEKRCLQAVLPNIRAARKHITSCQKPKPTA